MGVKGLVASIVQFLTQQLVDGDISADSRESIEVAIQCLESAYNIQASDAPVSFKLQEVYESTEGSNETQLGPEATPEAKAEAEKLKNEGNALTNQGKYNEALSCYTRAIRLDSRNAVYYCNRAAVHNKVENYNQAIKDCNIALAIDPSYSKVYGRLGLAYSNLNRHKEAKQYYEKALEIEPSNEGYRNNLLLTENQLAQSSINANSASGSNSTSNLNPMELRSIFSDPVVLDLAQKMISDPSMQNIVSGLMHGNLPPGANMGAFLEVGRQVGQQISQQLRTTNPEIIESLKQHMENHTNEPDPPPKN